MTVHARHSDIGCIGLARPIFGNRTDNEVFPRRLSCSVVTSWDLKNRFRGYRGSRECAWYLQSQEPEQCNLGKA